jgi:predicted aldo/keto reductase-like oxidoreductase
MPCPYEVNIPRNFSVYNQGPMYNIPEQAREWYGHIAEENRASACIQCRECEEKCPQHIIISEWMPIVDDVLGQGKPYVCSLP